jgi:aspartyl protease family protein
VGTFHYPFQVGDFDGRRFEDIDALVDTGATYTSIPSDVLERLGVRPQEQRPFILASGERVTHGIAWIRVRLDGREEPTMVIFGNPGSDALLGAFTLEGFGLGVDAVNRQLITTPGYLVGIRLQEPS